MASTRSLGTLTLDLIAKIGGFSAGMDQASKKADSSLSAIEKRAYDFGHTIGETLRNAAIGLGVVFGFKELIGSITDTITHMDEMSKSAQRVGVTTEAFSSLNYAAKLADVSTEDLQGTLGKLIKNLGMAQYKSSQQAQIFKALGIATTDSTGKIRDSIEVLKEFADRFKDLKGNPDAIAAGMAIFGKSFQTVIPLLKDGAEGISNAQAEADQLNATIGTDAGKAAEQFNDNINRLKTASQGLFIILAEKLIPTLNDWTDSAVELAKDNNSLDGVATGLTNTMESLAAIGHVLAASFKFIAAGVQSITVGVAAYLDTQAALRDALSHPYNLTVWKKDFADAQNASKVAGESMRDIWSKASDGINSSMDAASKNVQRIKGELVSFPKNQAASGASSFIDGIIGTDKEAEARAKKLSAALHKAFADPTGTGAAAAVKKAQALTDAYAKLAEAVVKTNESIDPNQKAYAAYAETVRNIDKLGADAIKKGGDVIRVQQEVAKGVGFAQAKLQKDLEAPIKAAAAYSDALKDQLKANQDLINSRVAAVGMGQKEAANQQELANVYKEGTKAITDFQRQHDLHPEAMTSNQYDTELKALKDYWDSYYQQTKDGQAAIDKANSDWFSGATAAWKDFFDEQANTAKIANNLIASFFSEGSDALASFIDGTKSASSALKDFINSFESEITKAISKQLFKQLFNIGGDNTGNGGWFSAIAGLFSGNTGPGTIGAGLAGGGPAAPGSIHPVNENGRPEMLSVGGRDYLMMGNRAGRVTPLSNQPNGSTVNQTNNFLLAAPTSPYTQTQIANKTAYEQRRASRFR